jgi:nucleoside-diphosphate-sugar epimerase
VRVLLTGADGYLGVPMGGHLLEQGHEVVGFDTGFYREGWLLHDRAPRPALLTGDVRDLEVEDLAGFDAVVHLAELSNDPIGNLDAGVTYAVNHHGTVRLAGLALDAGVRRFVHMSSCSVYGASGERASVETDPTQPLTPYAECKVKVEQDVGAMAGPTFAPTFLRNATVYGASPRQRFDLVVNDLTAWAVRTRCIRMASDGSPWRPFVHVRDVAKAVGLVLAADAADVAGEILNVGSDDQNHRVREVAEIVASVVDGCEVEFGPASADARDYKAAFSHISDVLPGFACDWTVERGVRELVEILERVDLTEDLHLGRRHVRLAQIRHLLDSEQVSADLRWRE